MSERGIEPQSISVLIDRRSFAAIEDAIRQRHICYMDEKTAQAGFQNVIVWGSPGSQDAIILIAGES